MTSASERVLDLDRRRRRALIEGDRSTLAGLVAPDAVFVHASGFVDDGASYVDAVAGGRVRYLHISAEQESATMLGPTAGLVVYRQGAVMIRQGSEQHTTGQCVATWAEDDTGGWRLRCFQITPIADR